MFWICRSEKHINELSDYQLFGKTLSHGAIYSCSFVGYSVTPQPVRRGDDLTTLPPS
jgi:hypothetical protein